MEDRAEDRAERPLLQIWHNAGPASNGKDAERLPRLAQTSAKEKDQNGFQVGDWVILR
ncbi:hypothetical protein [Bacillus safensis]